MKKNFAKNLQTLLVDNLVDVTKKETGSEKYVISESGDTTDSEVGGHRGEGDREDGLVEEALMQGLIKSAAEIFERLPSELSQGLLYTTPATARTPGCQEGMKSNTQQMH